MLLRQEQKWEKWILDLVSRFSRAGQVVQDICAGTLSTAKARLQLPAHRRFAECAKGSACFHDALP